MLGKTTFAALLALLFVVAAARGDQSPSRDELSPRGVVEKTLGRHAYGVYLQGVKIGWGVDEVKLGEYEGEPVGIATEESYLAVKTDDGPSTYRSTRSIVYSLEGDGPILYSELKKEEDGAAMSIAGVRKKDHFAITTVSGGRKTVRQTPFPHETLRETGRLIAWIESEPPAGESFTELALDLEAEYLNEENIFSFEKKETVRWGGVPMDAYHVRISMRGLAATAVVTADGRILRGKMGSMLEFRAEEESLAKKLDGPSFDMMAAGAITVSRDMGHPRKIDSLLLSITGLGDFAFPQSHRQRTEPGDDAVVLSLRRDFPTKQAQPLDDDQRAHALRTTPAVQSDHRHIAKLAAKIVDEETDPVKSAALISRWIGRHLKQSYGANASTALAVLDNRAGDCTEHALLFVALARAASVPARQVTGLAYVHEDPPIFGWHAWAEIHNGRQWITVDPMWQQVLVNAAHIKFSDQPDDWSWMTLIGQLKIEVLDFARAGEEED